MREIKVENEMVTKAEVNEYVDALFRKCGQNPTWYGATLDGYTEYVNYAVLIHFDYDKSRELNRGVATLEMRVGIRTMGTMTIEQMEQAAEEIKAATVIANRFNDRMNGVLLAD